MPVNVYKTEDGKRVPSVSTILKNLGWGTDALMYWAWEQGTNGFEFRETSDKLANIGNMAHFGVQAYVRGEAFDVDKIDGLTEADKLLTRQSLQAFYLWAALTSLKMEYSELRLVSERHRFGGQLDIGAINMSGIPGGGRRAIVDYKSGNAIYPKMILQVAGYGILWDEHNPGDPVTEYHIIRTGKENGSFEHRYWPAGEKWDEGPKRAFLLARELHDLQKMMKRF